MCAGQEGSAVSKTWRFEKKTSKHQTHVACCDLTRLFFDVFASRVFFAGNFWKQTGTRSASCAGQASLQERYFF
jgi:hypothetical protein